MSKAIISPSVLAVSTSSLADLSYADAQSDLSKLSDECKRMMDNGCDWLHMGESDFGGCIPNHTAPSSHSSFTKKEPSLTHRHHGRVRLASSSVTC